MLACLGISVDMMQMTLFRVLMFVLPFKCLLAIEMDIHLVEERDAFRFLLCNLCCSFITQS